MVQQSADNCPFPFIIELLSVDSTNNYALSLLKQEKLTERQVIVRHGTAVFAHEQYAGKGQRGRSWQSQKGKNIHLSIILAPQKIGIQRQFALIAIVAVAVRNFLETYANSDLTIKWPNDIYFKDRKVGGILIENIINGSEWKWAVAGVGVNINQTEFETELRGKAVSLKQITGRNYDCLELAKLLAAQILQAYNEFAANPSEALIHYNNLLYKKGEKVYLEKKNQQFEAVIKEVLSNGQLVVNTDKELRFNFGEIKWVME
ncbi:Bifunctional ligase/repressor BirA [Mycovorax composti]|uniref:Bifunctional ligase/repressor BirA n=1 Tax=Mycovorax composti TaxID=2962693 RepID=A0ABZ2EGG9_9BACT